MPQISHDAQNDVQRHLSVLLETPGTLKALNALLGGFFLDSLTLVHPDGREIYPGLHAYSYDICVRMARLTTELEKFRDSGLDTSAFDRGVLIGFSDLMRKVEGHLSIFGGLDLTGTGVVLEKVEYHVQSMHTAYVSGTEQYPDRFRGTFTGRFMNSTLDPDVPNPFEDEMRYGRLPGAEDPLDKMLRQLGIELTHDEFVEATDRWLSSRRYTYADPDAANDPPLPEGAIEYDRLRAHIHVGYTEPAARRLAEIAHTIALESPALADAAALVLEKFQAAGFTPSQRFAPLMDALEFIADGGTVARLSVRCAKDAYGQSGTPLPHITDPRAALAALANVENLITFEPKHGEELREAMEGLRQFANDYEIIAYKVALEGFASGRSSTMHTVAWSLGIPPHRASTSGEITTHAVAEQGIYYEDVRHIDPETLPPNLDVNELPSAQPGTQRGGGIDDFLNSITR
ncbi:MAG: hypothetical protein J0L97_03330 [Alphaproteobacteria bacterium]|nr:hypothetical protein [Alphaproteobacteria bacterium]